MSHSAPRIKKITRTMLRVPYTPRTEPWNRLLVRNWQIVEVCRVETESGVVGWGETLPHYGWGRVSDEAVARGTGAPLGSLLGDDSLGPGLQMALYDALGKTLGVPAHALFGLPKVRDWAPLAWWNTKMPPEVLAEEAKNAVAAGYTDHKIKARPWFDIYAQVEAISAVTPSHYKLDMDFNDMLGTVGTATRVLQKLDTYEKVNFYEGPLPQRDVAAYRELRSKTSRPLAIHFGVPSFPQVIHSQMCDGFVLNQGVGATLAQGQLAATFEMPFFLQLVGLGLTTALMAHLAAVLTHARWPAVTCLNNYSADLLIEPLTIKHGHVQVPDAPGLGVAFDEAALEKYRLEPPHWIAFPRHILTVIWEGGRKIHFPYMEKPKTPDYAGPAFSHLQFEQASASLRGRGVWEDFMRGNLPLYEPGVTLTVWDDDGSKDWAALYQKCLEAPVWD